LNYDGRIQIRKSDVAPARRGSRYQEMEVLRPLPDRRLESARRARVRVNSGSLIAVDGTANSELSQIQWVLLCWWESGSGYPARANPRTTERRAPTRGTVRRRAHGLLRLRYRLRAHRHLRRPLEGRHAISLHHRRFRIARQLGRLTDGEIDSQRMPGTIAGDGAEERAGPGGGVYLKICG
jgi:hypothetical protein